MKHTPATASAAAHAVPSASDMAALFGEYAALAQPPAEDSERLALAIRVLEMLQSEAHAAASAARPQ